MRWKGKGGGKGAHLGLKKKEGKGGGDPCMHEIHSCACSADDDYRRRLRYWPPSRSLLAHKIPDGISPLSLAAVVSQGGVGAPLHFQKSNPSSLCHRAAQGGAIGNREEELCRCADTHISPSPPPVSKGRPPPSPPQQWRPRRKLSLLPSLKLSLPSLLAISEHFCHRRSQRPPSLLSTSSFRK